MKSKLFIYAFFVLLLASMVFIVSCEDTILKEELQEVEKQPSAIENRSSLNPYDSVGILHNYYCNYVLEHTDVMQHQTLPYALDSLESFFLIEFNVSIELDSIVSSNGTLRDFSHNNNPSLNQLEKIFLDEMIISIESFNWHQNNPILLWHTMMDSIVQNALSAHFPHEALVLSGVSIAQHSGELWYNTIIENNPEEEVQELTSACLLMAITDDLGYLVDQGEGDSTLGELTVLDLFGAVATSTSSYINCAN